MGAGVLQSEVEEERTWLPASHSCSLQQNSSSAVELADRERSTWHAQTCRLLPPALAAQPSHLFLQTKPGALSNTPLRIPEPQSQGGSDAFLITAQRMTEQHFTKGSS